MKKLLISLVAVGFILPGVAFASIDTNLKYGSRGLAVSELQDFLIAKGFLSGQTSGFFFSLTRKAVIAYQDSVGLPATGFVGPMTRAKINDDLSTTDAPAVSAEITETGTTTSLTNTNKGSTVVGCTSTSAYSSLTGQPCNTISTSPLSTSTTLAWDACKNIEGVQTLAPVGMYADNGNCLSSADKTIQQLQLTVQQIQQNTQQLVQNTAISPPPADITPPVLSHYAWGIYNGKKRLEITANEPIKVKISILPMQTNTTTESANAVTKPEFIGFTTEQLRARFNQGLFDSELIVVVDDNFNINHEFIPDGLPLGVWYMTKAESTDKAGNVTIDFQ